MKYRIFLILLLNFTLAFGQEIETSEIEDYNLVKLINEIEILSEKKTDDLSLRIFKLANLPGSAGYASSEVTHDLLIAVSEYDELPDQSVFRVSSFYNPKIIDWKTETPEPVVLIEYGPYDDREKLTIRISLQKITLE